MSHYLSFVFCFSKSLLFVFTFSKVPQLTLLLPLSFFLSFCTIHFIFIPREMALIRSSFFSILFMSIIIIFSLLPIAEGAADTDKLKIGMVRDLYLRYADQDSTIYRGVVYWVNWVNSKGGFPYPNFFFCIFFIFFICIFIYFLFCFVFFIVFFN